MALVATNGSFVFIRCAQQYHRLICMRSSGRRGVFFNGMRLESCVYHAPKPIFGKLCSLSMIELHIGFTTGSSLRISQEGVENDAYVRLTVKV